MNLHNALKELPLIMSDEAVSPENRVALVCSQKDLPAARSYLNASGLKKITAICLFDQAVEKAQAKTLPPIVTMEELLAIQDVRPLLFAPDYFSVPVHPSCGFLAARRLAQSTDSFSLYPPLNHADWHARAFPDLYDCFGARLEAAYEQLEDENSRRAFAQAVKMLLTGNPGYVRPAPYPQYCHPIVQVRSGDIVIDGGAHALAETISFAKASQGGTIVCFEPEPSLYAQLNQAITTLPKNVTMRVLPFALGAKTTSCYIVCNDAGSWVTLKPREGVEPVVMRDLDSVLREEKISHVDVIKLDIEGCEYDALCGAADCIRRDRPKLMISAYHKKDDIVTIPELLRSLVPGYKFHFACHEMFCGEFLYYAHV